MKVEVSARPSRVESMGASEVEIKGRDYDLLIYSAGPAV
jgi:hypothetical protein